MGRGDQDRTPCTIDLGVATRKAEARAQLSAKRFLRQFAAIDAEEQLVLIIHAKAYRLAIVSLQRLERLHGTGEVDGEEDVAEIDNQKSLWFVVLGLC